MEVGRLRPAAVVERQSEEQSHMAVQQVAEPDSTPCDVADQADAVEAAIFDEGAVGEVEDEVHQLRPVVALA